VQRRRFVTAPVHERAEGQSTRAIGPWRARWQRGINEDTNGLLCQYSSKGTELAGSSEDHLDAVAAELNDRPCKRLEFQTAIEAIGNVLLRRPPECSDPSAVHVFAKGGSIPLRACEPVGPAPSCAYADPLTQHCVSGSMHLWCSASRTS
jgi:hypothetical protein